ncbi:FeoB-associated Cys-rich membrane protein [Ruminococcaceae bacterium BL-6]|jgi:uncharacterized protein (DUF779 family)|nr:FeoB-associated Cys-rich membrane protein [Ruminococcaceae bacterium BL-6]HBC27831.1 FeoB-associated Cys-rich membrane protein [Oscillospiraceae bacterium]
MSTIIVGAIILAILIFAGYKTFKTHKSGGCGCGCDGCSACCPPDERKKE